MRPLPLADPGTPPLRSPLAYLLWVGRRQAGILVAGVVMGILANVAGALLPYTIGRIVDDGLADGVSPALLAGCAVLLGVGLVQVVANVVGHRLEVENWIRSAFVSSQLIGRHVTRTGDAVTAELPTGEVVATVSGDALRTGDLYAIVPRFLGGIAAYATVAVVLMNTSVVLGALVLVGLPVVVGILALLVKPLQGRQEAQRGAAGRLTTLGADTVAGLRILRGIGGEEVFVGRYRAQSQLVRQTGVRVAQTQSLLDSLQTLLPGLFLAAVVWYGARLAIAGEITPGQLIAFYGFAAFLTEPLWTATEALRMATRAHIGARKILGVLRVPEASAADPEHPATVDPRRPLVDEVSGLVVSPGALVALVSADPDETAGIAARLGRFGGEPLLGSGVRWGGTLLSELRLAEVRERIVVAESTPHLFTGRLADELDVRGRASRADLERAMHVADAGDVLDSLPGGLDGELTEKGRSLSGGQRQRVALARALLTEAEVLVLVEPTSAVDAHTEARIATRLADARRGRTTVLVTASPLVLDVVDEVVLVEDGRVRVTGPHRTLMDGDDEDARAYRAVVSRAAAEEEESRAAASR